MDPPRLPLNAMKSTSSNVNGPKDVNVTVHDIKMMENKPDYKKNGYEVVEFPTSTTIDEFFAGNSDEGKKHLHDTYLKECSDLIKRMTGASVVYTYIYRVRLESGDVDVRNYAGKDNVLAPRPLAHLDRDPHTFVNVANEFMGEERTKELLSSHKEWAQVNTWRSIGQPATKWPLLFINHDEIPEWHFNSHCAKIHSKNDPRVQRRGEKGWDTIVKHDERYTYHYAKNLKPEETWVFNTFHTNPKLSAPHSAFWDDSTPEDAPSRRSIETRSLVFWE